MRKKLLIIFLGLFFALSSNAQNVNITGKVTDSKGLPIPKAAIIVRGTKIGTTSDLEGNFSLTAKPGATLVVTSVGFEPKEVKAQDNMTVSLNTDVQALSEIVVTGTGVATSKRKLGISVEAITGDKLPSIASATLDQALVGKIPGAQISSVSGNPGDQVNMVLRGINTVQGGTRPMILLDGVQIPFESLGTLNLGEVERVEVVQGAASGGLYGAQGANGVIQIFSKKGKKGKFAVTASSSISQNSFINSGHFGKANLHPYLTNASGNIINYGSNSGLGYTAGSPITIDPATGIILGSNSIAYRYGTDIPGLPAAGIPGASTSYSRYGILDPRNKADQPYSGNLHFYDHFAQVFQSAMSTNNAIGISGGSERMDFNMSVANNVTNSPMLKNNGYLNRTNVTVNLGFEVAKNLNIRSITNLVYTKNTMRPNLGAPGGNFYGLGNSNANVGGVYGFLNTSPFFSLEDTITGGQYASYQRASFLSVNAFNPFYRLEYSQGNSKRYDIMQSFSGNYKVNKFLSLDARYGITFKNENDVWTYYNQSLNNNTNYEQSWAYYNNANDATGEIDNFQYNNLQQNFYGGATIRTDFEKDFNIHIPIQTTTLVGFDYRRDDYKELNTWGYSLQLNPPFTLNSTQSQTTAVDYVQPFVTYGYLVDQKIDFGNYGGVAGGFRTDYSSAFGAGSKPFTFPHVQGYINFNSFGFWNAVQHTITSFKLRGAYGQAGIQPNAFDRYPVLTLQPTGTGVTYTNQSSAKNPNLNVEVSTSSEIGTEFGISLSKGNWLRSINVSFTDWKASTDNSIYYQNVPPSTGSTQLLTNAIALSSKGWQLGINIPVLASRNFTWDFTANFGHQVSVIDRVTGGDIPLVSAAGSTGLALAAGRKIGELYGYHALTAVDQLREDGKTPFIATSAQSQYSIVEGRVVNNTTKAIFFSDEATSLGDPNPKLTSSFINSFTWKGMLSFGFQVDWVYGSHLYNQTNEWMYRDGISSDFTKPVTINGQTGAWSAYYASAYYALGTTPKGVGNNVTKDFFYQSSSFARLRNISIGLDFSKIAKKEWLKKCQVVLSGRNLFTITKYTGMDPEISSGQSNSAFDRGVDHSTIPNLKSYQLSVNLAF